MSNNPLFPRSSFDDRPEPSTIQEAAQLLNLHTWKMRRAVKTGLIPSYTLLNSRRLVRLSEVLVVINASTEDVSDDQLDLFELYSGRAEMTDAITYKTTILTAAQDYVQKGYQLFLCGKDKAPLRKGGFKNASTDLKKLDRDLTRYPDGMLAIRTGSESGIIVIDIDVDEPKEVNGRPWLEEARAKGLPDGPTVQTPRGGLHLYFAHPGEPISNSAGALHKGVDVRGDSGYVIAPPSISPVGVYTWLNPLTDKPLSQLPPWLLEKLRRPKPELSFDLSRPYHGQRP